MNIEPLKKKIQEANPEILELKFGCEVENFFKGTAVILKVHQYEGESDCYDVAYYKLPELVVERTPFDNWTILGRPIRLADVLVAMRKNNRGQFYFRDDGVLFEWDKFDGAKNHSVRPTYIEWNLLDDNLDHQSDECKQFLTDLLV